MTIPVWVKLVSASSRLARPKSQTSGSPEGLGGGEPVRADHLERDDAIDADLASLVHDAHPTPGDLLEELIVAESAVGRAGGPLVPGRGMEIDGLGRRRRGVGGGRARSR